MASPDLLETGDLLVSQGLLVKMEFLEYLVGQKRDLGETMVILDIREYLVCREKTEIVVMMEKRVLREIPFKDPQGLMGCLEKMAALDSQDLLVILVSLEKRVFPE